MVRFAVPVAEGQLSPHFGHAPSFAFLDVDPDTHAIVKQETLPAPEHEHGLLPRWLHEHGVEMVIASGMGVNAQRLLKVRGIQFITGAPDLDPASLVKAYLEKTLVTGTNSCDH